MAALQASPPPAETGEHLPLIFLGIVIAELLAIAGLFWMGLHFGS